MKNIIKKTEQETLNTFKTEVPSIDFQWLCNEVSDYFIKNNSVVYDLGCSTDSYTKKLALRHKNKKGLKIYAIDVVSEMINFNDKN